MSPVSSRQAAASIRPDPQRLSASPPPITVQCRAPWSSVTRLMAPLRAPDPQEMPAPSKAGPAAVAQQYSPRLVFSAISPLVPASTSRKHPGCWRSPLAKMLHVISAPK